MILQCPKCKSQYNVDGSKITEAGAKITCPKCSHQFIVRKRSDEPGKSESPAITKPALKPQDKAPDKPKTPPCAICGAPSTHVLRGDPPRPLCEYHFRVEKERTGRFFEGAAGDPHPAAGAPPARPGASSPDPGATSQFDSFDEDFDFNSPAAPSPEATPAASEPAEESFVSSAHEFMDDAQAAASAPTPDKAGGGATPDPEPEFDFGAPPDPHEPSSAERDPFSSEGFGGDGDTDLSGEPIPKPAPAPAGDGFAGEEGFGEEEDGVFDFITPGKSKPPSAPNEPASAAPAPTAPVVRANVAAPAPARPQKSAAAAAGLSLAILAAAIGCGMFVRGGLAETLSAPPIQVTIESAPWQRQIPAAAGPDSGSPLTMRPGAHANFTPAHPVPDTPPSSTAEALPAAGTARTAKVRAAIFFDTPAGFGQAIAALDAAIAASPDPELLGLKAQAIAFNESLRDDGQTLFVSKQSRDFLASLDPAHHNNPFILRAKAHSLLNDKKTEAAKTILALFLDDYPGDPIGLYLMGLVYSRAASPDPAQASAYFLKAIAAEPKFARALWDLAELYRKNGRHDDAVAAYRSLLQASPERPGAEKAIAETEDEKAGKTLTFPTGEQPEPQNPLASTGDKFANDILEVIKDTQPRLRKFHAPGLPYKAPPPGSRQRPPEEAPR